MASGFEVRPASGTWVVRACGAVLGESDSALQLLERGHEPVINFPRIDVAMQFLDQSSAVTTCPWKGDATHYSIATTERTLRDAAWSYEAPHASAAAIKEHAAFHPRNGTAIEQLRNLRCLGRRWRRAVTWAMYPNIDIPG
ncbi:MAG: DUF427 domain-containing protein [Boseongicola sp. SB0676_bin_33]|uniref:DUF427 domain-containing protein n=1 Tax=Boseongicola sp. SB0664_bin_43 TaxID=2604844 RepID=A0A6B0Y4W0_9RHOB|nr:DUF427 domain-containing protein [Boseongicola sp. SB0664_bin_43]MYF88489.1 DUF427 domain-containing protein [Boseongicola sp. SB0676_bin_33]MYK32920.1 DUF427 domain-containing protein [Boseongicola sp. SB0670_bin_30]